MVKRMLFALIATCSFGLLSSHAQEDLGTKPIILPTAPIDKPKDMKDPAAYAIGFNIGMSVVGDGLTDKDIDANDFLSGFMTALSRKKPSLTVEQMQAALNALKARMDAKTVELAKANLAKANQYLEANKKKDGVQVTKSGLQYQVLKSGTGKSPTVTNRVTVHYEGKLIDGTVFDSSLKRNMPATFELTRIIKGWAEALQRMKVGDKWLVTIPPALGYGEPGYDSIGPNELLIFEMELLEVN